MEEFTVLYGSQTGQAKAIAEEISELAHQKCIKHHIHCLSLVDRKFSLEKMKVVVFVVSTTGEGEPPDTTLKVIRRLRKKTLPANHLSHLQYALLGLGDSNYSSFCNFGKTLDQRLEVLGATRFYPTGFADDAVGLEIVVEPWIEQLWPPLIACHLPSASAACNGDAGANGSFDAAGEPIATDVDEMSTRRCSTPSDCNAAKTSLICGSEEHLLSALNVPRCPAEYLRMQFMENDTCDTFDGDASSNSFSSSASEVVSMSLLGARQLTNDSAVRSAYEIELHFNNARFDYKPGDSIGVLCPNRMQDVADVISRLKLTDVADTPFQLELLPDTAKRAAAVPKYLPPRCTIRAVLSHSLDLTSVPKKSILRVLADHTHDRTEKHRLLELCSSQGAGDYSRFVRGYSTGFIDILRAFPSCSPPFSRLIELLPQLKPRPYSISCSPFRAPDRVSFVFSVIHLPRIPELSSGDRVGLCSGWLRGISRPLWNEGLPSQCADAEATIDDQLEKLSLEPAKIRVFLRKSTNFQLPCDRMTPMILIGPGTGVAPFLGFLRHRLEERKHNDATTYGDTFLFYGCRYEKKDFLFRTELEALQERRVLTRLFVSFSRDSPDGTASSPRYVQDNLRLHQELVLNVITRQQGTVYVCGDAKNMSKDVFHTFVHLLQARDDTLSDAEATRTMDELRKAGRYVEDVWT